MFKKVSKEIRIFNVNNSVKAIMSSKSFALLQENRALIVEYLIKHGHTNESASALLKDFIEMGESSVEVAERLNLVYRDPGEMSEAYVYLLDSGEQMYFGNYTDKVTVLGTGLQVGSSIVGLDFPGDIRDLSYDFSNWKWSLGHVGQTAFDALALLPLIGLLKYSDETAALVKNSNRAIEACFTSDTLVYTANGQVAIKDITIGDEVYSRDTETGEQGLKKVKRVFVHDKDRLLILKAGDLTIETTHEHPFWIIEKGWVRAENINIGDNVSLYDGTEISVNEIEERLLDEPIKVYNFEVEEWHTYFVSDHKVLVHNKPMKNKNLVIGPVKGTGNLGKLTKLGDNAWESSAGLIYGADKKFGNRVKHVLAHGTPNPSKASHTVFNVGSDEILGLVDEAWTMKGNPLTNDPGAYLVDMGRTIGTNGESTIKVIVKPGTSEIITAYPVK